MPREEELSKSTTKAPAKAAGTPAAAQDAKAAPAKTPGRQPPAAAKRPRRSRPRSQARLRPQSLRRSGRRRPAPAARRRGENRNPGLRKQALAEELSEQGAGRDRAADGEFHRRPSGQRLQAVCRPSRLHLHGQDHQLRRGGAPVGGLRRFSPVERPRQGRARRHHDAERAAISGRDDGHPARRLHRGERQPALYAARTRAPAQGFGRRGDHHPGEFREDAPGGDIEDAGQACRGGDARATCWASRDWWSISSCAG